MDATVSDDPVVGRLLDGRYTVRERLAVGGMATVYVAHDNRLDRLVALKVMHPGYAHDRDYVARFHREAKAAARLNSPHLVSVLDQGTDDGPGGRVVYLVMELIRGRTLRQLLSDRGPLPVDLTVTIIEPVVAALAAAHHAGIIHRDIKPENILLGDDGRVKVADFGLARPMANGSPSLTQGVLMGTVGYLAPEQVATGRADARSDVYAAGIVLFEMLTGQTPHDGATPIAVAYQHVHGDVPPPSAMRRDVGPAMNAFVLTATARDPDQRPSDGGAMLAQLLRERPRLLNDIPVAGNGAGAGTTALMGASAATATAGPATGETGLMDTGPIGSTAEFDRTALDSYRRAHYGDDDAPPPPGGYHRGAGGSRYWVIGAVAAGVVILLIALVMTLTGGGATRVPPLDGLSKADATTTLTENHFKAAFDQPAYDENTPAGKVLSQRPAAGSKAKGNSVVHVVMSLGAKAVVVPDVQGLSESDADKKLEASGLKLAGLREENNNDVQKGNAVRTEPQAGTQAHVGDSVTLITSSGSDQILVPNDLVGQKYDDAKKELEALGLKVHQDTRTSLQDKDTVLDTSPDPGQRVNAGGTVTLIVARGLLDEPGNDNGGDGQQVQIPSDLVGQTGTEASKELRAEGLSTEVVGRRGGHVYLVIPGQGNTVDKGSKVQLWTSF